MARAFASVLNKQLRTSSGKADTRAKLIGAVHAAAKKQGIDEDTRREIYKLATDGKNSLTKMTLPEIGKVLDRLNAGNKAAGLSQNARPHVGKVRALWWTLYWLGETESPNDSALDAFVRRQTGISSLRFLDPRRAPAVIEALKAMVERAGVAPVAPAESDHGRQERHAVIACLWRKLTDAAVIKNRNKGDFLRQALLLPGLVAEWSNRDLDEAIKLLGKRWRSHLARQERRTSDD
jgi:hypothetical protein